MIGLLVWPSLNPSLWVSSVSYRTCVSIHTMTIAVVAVVVVIVVVVVVVVVFGGCGGGGGGGGNGDGIRLFWYSSLIDAMFTFYKL